MAFDAPKFSRLVLTASVALSVGSTTQAGELGYWHDDYLWSGAGADAYLSTNDNWVDGSVNFSDNTLIFDSANVAGAAYSPVNNAVNPLSVYAVLFKSGSFNLSGNTVSTEYVRNDAGNNTISANLNLIPGYGVRVNGGSLTLAGDVTGSTIRTYLSSGTSLDFTGTVSTSGGLLDLRTVTGSSVSIAGTTSTGILRAYGNGSLDITEQLAISDNLTASYIETSTTLAGANGAIIGNATARGLSNSGDLLLDNSAVVNNDRLGDSLALSLNNGGSLTVLGNAIDSVSEVVDKITVSQGTINIDGSAGGDTTLTVVGNLNIASDGFLRINNTGSAALGDAASNTHFYINTATEGNFISGAVLNGNDFVSYGVNGVQSATTSTNLVTATVNDHVRLDTDIVVSGAVAVNTLAVSDGVASLSGGSISAESGQVLLNGTNTISTDLAFGTQKGKIYAMGNTVLTGNLDATNGLNVTGDGHVTVSGTGVVGPTYDSYGYVREGLVVTNGGQVTIDGSVSVAGADVNNGRLNLGVNNAIDSTSYLTARNSGVLDIGSSSQQVAAFFANSGAVVESSGGHITTEYARIDDAVMNADLTVIEPIVTGSDSVRISGESVVNSNITTNGNMSISGGADYLRLAGVQINGSVTAENISMYGTINSLSTGSIQAATEVQLYDVTQTADISGALTVEAPTVLSKSSHFNGAIVGASNLVVDVKTYSWGGTAGYTSLWNQNIYTGSTTVLADASLSLYDNATLANTSGINLVGDGSSFRLQGVENDAGTVMNRIADTAVLSMGGRASYEQYGSVGVEVIGGINVQSGALATMEVSDNSYSHNGTTGLQAGSLNVASDAVLLLMSNNTLGESNLVVSSAIGSNADQPIANVYLEGIDNNVFTWGTYDASGEIVEYRADALSLASPAATNNYVRVTDATNAALGASGQTVKGLYVDTTQTMSGTGTLNVSNGEVFFGRDNTLAINTIDFGAKQGRLSNAANGVNTIDSNLSGTGGLMKIGNGTIVLTADNTYSGKTMIEQGTLQVDGSITSNIEINRSILPYFGGSVVSALTGSGEVNGRVTVDGGVVDGLSRIQGSVINLDGTIKNVGTITGNAINGQIDANGNVVSNINSMEYIDRIFGNLEQNGRLTVGGQNGGMNIGGDLLSTAYSDYIFDLSGDPVDAAIHIGGDFVFDGDLVFEGLDGIASGNYLLFDWEGSLTDNGGDRISGFMSGGFSWTDTWEMYDLSASFLFDDVAQEIYLSLDGGLEGGRGPADYSTSAVPVPAAVWLFGSGLIGLIGMARRKKV